MAVIKLTFQPDTSKIQPAIKEIQNQLNSLANVHIKVDSAGAKATQQIATNLQNAVSSAEGLGRKLRESFTVNASGATKKVVEYQNAVGQVTRVVMQATDAEQTYSKTVITNYQAQEKEAKRLAAEKEKQAKQAAKAQEDASKRVEIFCLNCCNNVEKTFMSKSGVLQGTAREIT